MKLEVGRFYRTRNGSKVRFVGFNGSHLRFFIVSGGHRMYGIHGGFDGGFYETLESGRFSGSTHEAYSGMDIVEPWPTPQVDRSDAMEMILLCAVRAIGVGRALEIIEDRAYEALEEQEREGEE